MEGKTAKIVNYITWIGWLIVFFAGKDAWQNDEGVKQHLNQGLICLILAFIPIGITQIASLIFAVWGIIKACQDDDTELPLIGSWRIIKELNECFQKAKSQDFAFFIAQEIPMQ